MGLFGFFTARSRIDKVVALASNLLALARRAKAGQERIAADPDKALEDAIRAASEILHIPLDAKEARRAITHPMLVNALQNELGPRAQKLRDYLESQGF